MNNLRFFLLHLILLFSHTIHASKNIRSLDSVTDRLISNFDQSLVEQLQNWATYIIVGAGAAGSVVAARLAENPNNNILIIELGPNNLGNSYIQTPGKYALLWDNPMGPQPSPTSLAFETETQIGRKYRYPRGNGLGGSTNHHSIIDGWGSGLIYDAIAALVNDNQWAWQSISSYFKKMESFNAPSETNARGTNGWLNIISHPGKSLIHQDFMNAAHEVTGAPIKKNLFGTSIKADGISPVNLQENPDISRSAAFSNLLLPQMKQSKNIIILFNTLATKIIIEKNENKLRATGVEIFHKSNIYEVDNSLKDPKTNPYLPPLKAKLFAKKEVILCGGAINTPQLLLLSGIGPAQHLQEMGIPVILDKPGVGSQLLDHNEIAVTYEIDANKFVWPGQAAEIIENIDKKLEKTFNTIKKNELLKLRARFEPFADKQEQKMGPGAIIVDWYSGLPTEIGHDLHLSASEKFWFDFDFKNKGKLPDGKTRGDYFNSEVTITDKNFPRVFHHFLLEVLKVTNAEGTIRLQSSNPLKQPRIDLALYKDEEALERLARGILMIREMVKHPLVKKHYKLDSNGDPIEIFPGKEVKTIEQLKEYLKRWSVFGHHISGTAKMGRNNNPLAVTDTKLRVLGIPNLRIIDTSIYPYPYLHGYNTARSAYLVGEIGADFIKSDIFKLD